MGLHMLKIRRLWDHLIFNMEISILVRRHLYIETDPCTLFVCTCIYSPILAYWLMFSVLQTTENECYLISSHQYNVQLIIIYKINMYIYIYIIWHADALAPNFALVPNGAEPHADTILTTKFCINFLFFLLVIMSLDMLFTDGLHDYSGW